ncbi:MAG: hypothetical protein RL701_746 [Pseudomonadota bacterium]
MGMEQRKKPVIRLVPARPPTEDDAIHRLSKFSWRYLVLGVVVLSATVGGYLWKEQRKAESLRARILHVHKTELADARTTYQTFRRELERLTTSAAVASTDTYVAPDFQLQDLSGGRGSYLRIPLVSAGSPDKIAQAAKGMQPDWIPSCLGLAPATSRELYEIGEFLLPSFVADVAQKDVMHLRVQDDTLTRRVRQDLPNLLATTRSDWFMLVLEEGESRRDEPVRTFIWDLKRDALLVRARVRGHNIVTSAHIESKTPSAAHGKPAHEPHETNAETLNDCSIASALKQLTSH